VSPLTREEIGADDIKDMKRGFTMELNERLKNEQNDSEQSETAETVDYSKYSIPIEVSIPTFTEYEDEEEDAPVLSDINGEEDQVEFDKYISSTVRLMEDNVDQIGVIKGRKRGADGKFIGKFHANPILDTSTYEVEFEDGRVESYYANQIAESILEESEINSNMSHHISEFVDHRKGSKALNDQEAKGENFRNGRLKAGNYVQN